MSHLAITLNGKYLVIKPDTEITIEDSNPYFNEQSETMSLPFTVPIDGNREHFGDIENIESDARLLPLEGGVMGVEVDGILMRSGKVGTIDDQDLKTEVGLQMVSAVHSLDEYLDGVRCRDVDVIDDIPIGETIGNIRANYEFGSYLYLEYCDIIDGQVGDLHYDVLDFPKTQRKDVELSVQLPALGFSRPERCVTKSGSLNSNGSIKTEPSIEQSFINVDTPYPAKPYCNTRICYTHYAIDDDGTSSDNVEKGNYSEYSKYNPYMVLEANRPASGICFYVLYFLDCLFARFKEDGIVYDNSELLKVKDLCRLAFVTTHCKFDVKKREDTSNVHLQGIDQINEWLHSRKINTTLSVNADYEKILELDTINIEGSEYTLHEKVPANAPFGTPGYFVTSVSQFFIDFKYELFADVMTMYANSQNFPDADAKDIIDSLWGSFGIRFYLDQQTRVVKPMFIRDIFRDQSEAITFPCVVVSATKSTEHITGFRMQYSGTSDRQQREDNITLGVRDYDTTYDYQDYRNLDASLPYSGIIAQAYDNNMTCYADLTTGNLYRVKIDGDADTRDGYNPVIFEVRQLSSVEIGDCSEENEEFVQEVSSSFQPVVFNDVNFKYERKSWAPTTYLVEWGQDKKYFVGVSGSKSEQILSAYVGEDMWHEEMERKVVYAIGHDALAIDLTAITTTVESFDVESSDDGDSPLQSLDWGLAVAIMRGGGSTASIEYYDYDYDGFGNCKFRMVAGGDYTMSLDSIDAYGKPYDYNGELPGTDHDTNVNDEAISLKIRSYIEAPYDVTGPNGEVIKKGTPLCKPEVQKRGLYDQFFSEYAHFLLNRKKVKLEIQCEPAALTKIEWHRRYRFGDYVGWIDKIRTTITAESGITKCEVDLFVL